MKLLSRLRLQFTYLNEHKFRHGFNETVNPMCSRGNDVETTEHFLLRVIAFLPRDLYSSIIFTD